MADAVSMLFLCEPTLSGPLVTAELPLTGEILLALPALSNLPSESRYAGLNVSLPLEELSLDNNAFGAVSYMLPIEV